jgi:hypothetical protein
MPCDIWGETLMGSKLSVDQILEQLQAKVAHHAERRAFHAQQEAFHHDQAAVHGTELAAATERLEAFRAAAEAAGELLERSQAATVRPADKDADEDLGKGRKLSRLIARVLESKRPDEVFGPAAVTDEINERWGSKLRRKADPRNVAATLRRWAISGRIHRTKAGRAYHESLYVKEKPAATPGQ